MALIACKECGREISEKAVACPGCGCPTIANAGNELRPVSLEEAIKNGPPYEIRRKYAGYDPRHLFNIGFELESSGATNHVEAVYVYQLVMKLYPSTKEASKANNNLERLTGSQRRKPTEETSQNNGNEIPTYGGLVVLAFITGLGFFGGLAVGQYIRTKSLIRKGDYEGALKSSSATLTICMITIVGIPVVGAGILMFAMPN